MTDFFKDLNLSPILREVSFGMTDLPLLRRLRSPKKWNQWRNLNPEIQIDLSSTNLRRLDLQSVDLSGANLEETDLKDVRLAHANLTGANLRQTNLKGADLTGANLTGADLTGANLTGADLTSANLTGATLDRVSVSKACFRRINLSRTNLGRLNLRQMDLNGAILQKTSLSGADLKGTNLTGADLSDADLSGANLSEANLSVASLVGSSLNNADLSKVQALRTNFNGATLTGACISDWNVNSDTCFNDIVCDYVYLLTGRRERRPREGFFSIGEFSALCRYTIDTIDIFFEEGIDWSAFFHAFQEMSLRCVDQDFAIQAIEKKAGNAFVVRLEVSQNLDKAAIERQFRDLYGEQLRMLEAQYEKIFSLQNEQRDNTRRLIEEERKEKATLMGVIKTMADNQGPKNDFRGAQFAGGYAENLHGNQIGGSINNYSLGIQLITQLIDSLRGQAQVFPQEHKDEALSVLDILEDDLRKPQIEPQQIGRRLKQLGIIATKAGTIAGSAATFSGNINEFTSNISNIAKAISIPLEYVQSSEAP